MVVAHPPWMEAHCSASGGPEIHYLKPSEHTLQSGCGSVTPDAGIIGNALGVDSIPWSPTVRSSRSFSTVPRTFLTSFSRFFLLSLLWSARKSPPPPISSPMLFVSAAVAPGFFAMEWERCRRYPGQEQET